MFSEQSIEKSRGNFVSRVMTQMGIGLFITFLMAYLTYSSYTLQSIIFGSTFVMFGLIIVEFILVVTLSRRIEKMSIAQARGAFYLYAVINGLTLSVIFMAYDIASIYVTFFIASIMFMSAGLIGITIKRDLSAFGQFLYMMLLGIIIVSVVNMFFSVPMVDISVAVVGILVFSGLTAYDMQKIKEIHYNAYEVDENSVSKYAIIGALELYLDFINLFLYLLRLFGKRK